MEIVYQNKNYTGEFINVGFEKYFIDVIAKVREDDSFDNIQLIISELQLNLINTIILHKRIHSYPWW